MFSVDDSVAKLKLSLLNTWGINGTLFRETFHLSRVNCSEKNHAKNPKSILNGEQNFNAMKIGTEEGTVIFNMCGVAIFYRPL